MSKQENRLTRGNLFKVAAFLSKVGVENHTAIELTNMISEQLKISTQPDQLRKICKEAELPQPKSARQLSNADRCDRTRLVAKAVLELFKLLETVPPKYLVEISNGVKPNTEV